MKSFKLFYEQADQQYVVLLPGGYKPPTRGHMHMIREYNDNPIVKEIIVMIGPKDREGFTREQSLEVFDLYGVNSFPKIRIVSTPHNSPIAAGIDFVEKDADIGEYKGSIFTFGSSGKGEDSARISKLVDYFKKYPEKLRPGLEVGVLPPVRSLKQQDVDVSATALRQAISNKDIKTIASLIPSGVNPEEFLKIYT